jgi:hypothetical protein
MTKIRALVITMMVIAMTLLFVAPAFAIGMSGGNFFKYNFEVTQGQTIYPSNVYVSVFTSGNTTLNCAVTTETPAGITMLVSPTSCTVSAGYPCKVSVISISASSNVAPGKYIVYIRATEVQVSSTGGISCVGAVRFPAYVTVLLNTTPQPLNKLRAHWFRR